MFSRAVGVIEISSIEALLVNASGIGVRAIVCNKR